MILVTFFGVESCGKKKSKVVLSVVRTLIHNDVCQPSGENLLRTHKAHSILTTVMMNIVVDKSTDNAEPLSIC